jgi:NAD+ synthase
MPQFSADVLKLNVEQEVESIVVGIRNILRNDLKRRGIVVGLSGGIDSSVTAALAVKSIGKERVFGLEMPELHSSKETPELSSLLITHLGIDSQRTDISDILNSIGFYRDYDDAIKKVIPAYGNGWKSKVVISSIFDHQGFSLNSIVAESPDGQLIKERLPLKPYLEIIAATNCKQRTRKLLEYYHADRLNYAVAGTPNRLEFDQGFFVKLGDGAADIKPIAHLYKSQVYQLAEYLDVPKEICRRSPTTDTFSLPQGQDEFYFSLPYQQMDLCLFAKNNGIPVSTVASTLDISTDQVQRVFDDIDTKRSTTRYLHLKALTIKPIAEIQV